MLTSSIKRKIERDLVNMGQTNIAVNMLTREGSEQEKIF